MQLQNWIILFRKRHGVWLFYCPRSRNIVKILKLQLFHFISYYSVVIIKVGQLFCDQSIKVSQDTGIIGRYQRGVKIFENWWTIYKELSVLKSQTPCLSNNPDQSNGYWRTCYGFRRNPNDHRLDFMPLNNFYLFLFEYKTSSWLFKFQPDKGFIYAKRGQAIQRWPFFMAHIWYNI